MDKLIATEEFPSLHRFNVQQYYRIGELGLLDHRTELLEGIITDMAPIGPWHASILQILTQLFAEHARGRFNVRVQLPIDLGAESQPQPDLVLCRLGVWRDRHPGAADIFLAIEVGDSSLAFDLGKKLELYAQSDITEYWVLDLKAKIAHCFRSPEYEHQTLSDSISPVAWPDIRIDLRELLA